MGDENENQNPSGEEQETHPLAEAPETVPVAEGLTNQPEQFSEASETDSSEEEVYDQDTDHEDEEPPTNQE
jgi:hypothetical protein